jgi:hypothetical protein
MGTNREKEISSTKALKSVRFMHHITQGMNDPSSQCSHTRVLINLKVNSTNDIRQDAFIPLDDHIKQVECHLKRK